MRHAVPVAKLTDLSFRRPVAAGQYLELRVPQLSVAAGAKIALVGPSGSGKSTLLDLLGLCLPPTGGNYWLAADGGVVDAASLWQPIRPAALCALRRRATGYILQTGGLLPFLCARDNIAMAMPVKDPDVLAKIADQLALSAQLLARKPASLSIGERQRVAIARALVHRPKLILADEPTASLDPHNADATLTLLCQALDETGCAAVMVTHNRELAERFGFQLHELDIHVSAQAGMRISTLCSVA
ncbi:MAG: ATP-binding cassette domain-containing protein [Gammaproteobacteria bacterium]|nr:ATP-binding cassette domain-containing protein [Gammaproteobacteria bacterium]